MMESAKPCDAQKKDSEKKTLNNLMSASRRGRHAPKTRSNEYTAHAHKMDAHGSRKCRISENGKHKHEEHIADSLVHLPIPFPKALRIPEAMVAVDKEWDTLKHFPA